MRTYVLPTITILLIGMIAVPTGIAAPLAQQPTPTPKWDTPTPPAPTSTPEPPPPTFTPEPPPPTSTLEPTAAPTTKPRSKPRNQPSPTPVPVLLPESGKQDAPLGLAFLVLLVPAIGFLLRTIGRLVDR
jgi:outer membrane biosynthesis protein TonB